VTIQNSTPPSILFLCVHNAGRSQMAAGLTRHFGGGSVRVYSGGSEPADRINPAAIAAMAEIDIDIATQTPQTWTDEAIAKTDVVITMGCGDTCPILPGVRYIDWELDDPAGKPIDQVRPIETTLKSEPGCSWRYSGSLHYPSPNERNG